MRISSLLTVATVAGFVAAAPAPAGHVLHEKRSDDLSTWMKKERLHPMSTIPVRIGMTQSNLDYGHDMLMEVAQHDSPKYGKHYTQEQIHELFQPSAKTVETLRGWLEGAGIAKDRVSQSFNKQWLQFDSSVGELEGLVKAEYYQFEHDSGRTHVACDEYHIPGHVSDHVDYITYAKNPLLASNKRSVLTARNNRPGIKLMTTHGKVPTKSTLEKREQFKLPVLKKPVPTPIAQVKTQAAAGNLALCDAIITPACIRAMYNFTVSKTAAAGNELGIFEDLGDHYAQEDLNLFFEDVATRIPQGTHPELRAIDGATGPNPVGSAGAESDLDFSISYPIIYPQNSVLFQTDDDVTENNYTYAGFLNNFFDAIDGSYCPNSPLDPQYPDTKPGGFKGQLQCGKYTPTNVISISYGGIEAGLPVKYLRRQCTEIMKLGMQGVSVIVSSSDYGVAGSPGSPTPNGCLGPHGGDNNNKSGTVFAPDFPAGCPYITSIGSTFLPPGADVNADAEVATTRFASGGGFSNVFAPASYQTSAVNGYLTKFPPPYMSYSTTNDNKIGANGGIFNAGGRGYPDFAAVGDNVLIYNEGSPILIGGTSASSPAFAALLTRINEARLGAGKSTIGFVNPTLYANPQVLHDITVGNNPGCGTNGFSAAAGWDPVTGLGTPDYPKMLDLFMGLA
ncbi:MAG: hypothetical protein M1828_007185 [Chrysothrix sp. TS-e1954]|nr:MAG: hypothetical protein M1828_007185 [Chrysothrix sp. TS-e1954]